MGSSVSFRCILNREYLKADEPAVIYLALDIMPPDESSTSEIMPSAICLLIDRSGSMLGRKLNQARAAAQKLVDQLQPGDSIGMLTFSSKVEPIIDLQQIQYLDIADFKKKIQKIRCGGGTELYRGLDAAYMQFMRSGNTTADVVKRVILLSDGEPTDHTPESHFSKLATEMGNAGISIMALGIGKEYNEDLMGEIAECSRGVWKHISDADDIPGIFTQQLEETRAVVRTSLRMSMNLESFVGIQDIYKQSPENYHIDFTRTPDGEIKLALGDIRSGERQMVVAKLELPARPEGQYLVGRVYLSDNPGEHADIYINYTADENKWSVESNSYPRGAFMQSETQALTRKGLSGDTTALEQARQRSETLARDPNLRRISALQDDITTVRATIARTSKGMSEEETKVAKHDLTQTRRAR